MPGLCRLEKLLKLKIAKLLVACIVPAEADEVEEVEELPQAESKFPRGAATPRYVADFKPV